MSSNAYRILDAMAETDDARVGELLAADPLLANWRDAEGRSLLLYAAMFITSDQAIPAVDDGSAYRDVVRALLSGGVDTDVADENGLTPLHCASAGGLATWLVDALLRGGANPALDAWGLDGATPLALALFYRLTDNANRLASASVVPNNLRTVAALGQIDDVREWLAGDRPRGAPEAAPGWEFGGPQSGFPLRTTPVTAEGAVDESLTWASRNGQLPTMEMLVEAGADVNANPFRGTALLWAIYADDVGAATWLLDHGADPDLRHDFGGTEHGTAATAMHLAAQYGSLGCLRLLLDRGADATIRDGAFDSTPLGWAQHVDQTDSIAILEAHRAPGQRPA